MSEAVRFEPSRFLTKVGGADYLEVKWRLVWLREAHPDAVVETELVSHDGSLALFRARVSLPNGGSATGWGSEGIDDFRDYIEKAETKALGRALAALGFGTQFCPDFDFGAGAGRVVDAPIDFASSRGRQVVQGSDPAGGRRLAVVDQPATQRQLKFIQAIAREAGLSEGALATEVEQRFGVSVDQISRRDASALIEDLQSRRSADIAS